jgi:hypothetical protein
MAGHKESENKKDVAGAPPVVVSRVVNVTPPAAPVARTTARMPGVPPPLPPRTSSSTTNPKVPPPPSRQLAQKVSTAPPAITQEESPVPAPTARFGSVRPPTVDKDRANLFDPVTSPSLEGTFERLLSDVDASFASLETDSPPESGRSMDERDLADVRELFAQLAAKHMRSVRDFMIELNWGDAPQSWIAVSEPAVRSLRGAAARLELAELAGALDGLGTALRDGTSADTPSVCGEGRTKILEAYSKLAEVMPQAFALEQDQAQRESVIVHSLLSQVPGVRKVTIDKLYAAGLSSLDTMFAARGDEMAHVAGIERDLADRIVERFQHYKEELASTRADADRAPERERLATLVKRLRHQHDEYENLSKSWSNESKSRKKSVREARAATLSEVNVVLARLGEVERLQAIEKLPFDRKLEAIEAYLAEAENAVAQR